MVGQELQQEACPKWLSDLATHKSLREQRGGRDPQVVQRVCKEVRDCDVSVRLNATRSLGSITPHCDHDVINTLLGQDSEFGLNDVSSSVRAAAAEALGVVASGTNDELVCELLVRRFEVLRLSLHSLSSALVLTKILLLPGRRLGCALYSVELSRAGFKTTVRGGMVAGQGTGDVAFRDMGLQDRGSGSLGALSSKK